MLICHTHDALILFDPGSTHNFISHELALKLGIHEFEMGDCIQANGAFKAKRCQLLPSLGSYTYIVKAMWIRKIFIFLHSSMRMLSLVRHGLIVFTSQYESPKMSSPLYD